MILPPPREPAPPPVNPVHRIPYHVGRYLRPDGPNYLPPEVEAWIEREEQRLKPVVERNRYELVLAQEQIEADLADYAQRRKAEHALGKQCLRWFDQTGIPALREISERFAACRQGGHVGITEDHRTVIAWESKCRFSKLCPDEERLEQRRLDRRYIAHMLQFATHPLQRIFYCVLTLPNFPRGSLAEGQREILERFKREILKGRDEIPEHERTGRKRYRERFPQIKGAFVTLEAPLSASRDWNVHLNVLLMVRGELSFKRLREAWGYNLEIRELKADTQSLAAAIREVVKYSVQLVPTKSAEKREKHATEAPPMVEWTADEFLEWWYAQKGFRRTRTYGCLYRLPAPPEEEVPLVQWIGRVGWDAAAGCYAVALIRADNFSVSPPPPDPEPPEAWPEHRAGLDPGGGFA